jgi:hypothetical protein
MAQVIYTQHFKNAVDSQISYYEAQQAHYPDAGRRISQFLNALEHQVVPTLEAHPHGGRPVLFDLASPLQDVELFRQLNLLVAKGPLQARRWVITPFVVLYFQSQDAVYLVSMKHSRQQDFF